MNQTPLYAVPARLPHPRVGWRILGVPLLGLVTAVVLLLAPAFASADSSTSLSVVGTSDVSDSGLMQNVIQPAFHKAFPQFTFKYTGTATGTAISNAESGTGGPSALIVHAASLENQFVANGFSFEQYGRALFINDFVLGGPKSDPAGVAANGAHNIAHAFADIAAAGMSGRATFVSRGGTPGTTVEEHQIWQLVSSAGLAPSGLLLCAVSAKNGGGLTPIAAGHGVTASGQACPGGGALPTGSALPTWYATTGLTQGPNVVAANACNGFPSGPSSCYVLTDRGTYDYLASGTDPLGAIPNLTIATRDDDATAPGGEFGLVNYFHVYIINPSKPGETVNLAAAKDFVNLITAKPLQSQLKAYLATSDPGGPPFTATASPLIGLKGKGIPRTYHAGKPFTLRGTLSNAQPGYPSLSSEQVFIDQIEGGIPVQVATGRTDKSGNFSIRYVPSATAPYEVSTDQIAKIEIPTLNPVFGDLLSPAATASIKTTVHSAIQNFRVKPVAGQAVVIGSVAPGTNHVKGSVTVFTRKGSKGAFKKAATNRLGTNDANFAVAVPLAARGWQIKTKFQDPKQLIGSTSRTAKVTVKATPTATVRFGSVKTKRGTLRVSGKVNPAVVGRVKLLALKTEGEAARFDQKAKVTVRGGQTSFTLRARLKRQTRWRLQLEYLRKGPPSSFSVLRTVNVR